MHGIFFGVLIPFYGMMWRVYDIMNQDDDEAELVSDLLILMNRDGTSVVRLDVSHSKWNG